MSTLASKLILLEGYTLVLIYSYFGYSANKFYMASWPVINYKGEGKADSKEKQLIKL